MKQKKNSNIRIFFNVALVILFAIHSSLLVAQEDTLHHQLPPQLARHDSLKNVHPAKTDTVKKLKKHNPTMASLFSATIPGLGQAYNKKYWKIPIIYGGIGTLAYYSIKQNDGYQLYKEAYIARTDTSALTIASSLFDNYTNSDLENIMNQYRRARDFNYVIIGVIYIFNIIDASVDAHLFDYDVSEDLSLKVNPNFMVLNNRKEYVGLQLTFTFK